MLTGGYASRDTRIKFKFEAMVAAEVADEGELIVLAANL